MPAVVRPARAQDLDRLTAMIADVDRGMLTMPSSREEMAVRIERSDAALARPPAPPVDETYFLILEEDGEILGSSGLFTNLGSSRPFYSYRISRDSKVSPELGVKVELDLLHLVNDYHGDTELGTLFLTRNARGGGRGRLLSFARLMLIAVDPLRFGAKAMAEIRGWTDTEGRSPFWDAVGAKFFRMDYQAADRLSARDHRFISDLMPRYPIYADLLPQEARDVVARPHPDAEPAFALLKSQGFRYNNVVDIFDAGPCVEAFVDHIDVVRGSTRMSAQEFVSSSSQSRGLVGACSMQNFAVTLFGPGEDRARTAERIGVSGSDQILVYETRSRDS
ncbi:MAG: arginine N-succinyltransferase [Hyphomonadaceae bacterium]